MLANDQLALSASQRGELLALNASLLDLKKRDVASRDSGLLEAANAVLKFRQHVSTFAESQDLAKLVFLVRNEMTRNSFRKAGPFGSTYTAIVAFASAINTARRTLRLHQQTTSDRVPDAVPTTEQQDRVDALSYAARLDAWRASPFQIPSLTASVPEPAVPAEPLSISISPAVPKVEEGWPASPRDPDMALRTASPVLSPLPVRFTVDLRGIDALIAELRLMDPSAPAPLPSPVSPSMPELESVSDSESSRSTSPEPYQPVRVPTVPPIPVVTRSSASAHQVRSPLWHQFACNTRLQPGLRSGPAQIPFISRRLRPEAASFYPRLNRSFVDDLAISTRRSSASAATAKPPAKQSKPRRGKRGKRSGPPGAVAPASQAQPS
ncbi:CCHC-type domain-containing protein [Mycena chlorophos]|uniref:CCHC-type domain-containing protein n=1 Tax=Mycena chlorophos TaxID=658473 RepID=A0A8H6SBA6_MYCCL|nr:CCHC-type domain-containing protein [Mycena chlorophos]